MKIKFLTLNIWHGGIVWDNLVDFIKKEDPDIAFFQEVYGSENTDLEKRFRTISLFKKEFPNLAYHTFGPKVIDTTTKSPQGDAIFSKFPLVGEKVYFFDSQLKEHNLTIQDPYAKEIPEGMLESYVEIDGKKVWLYNWHGIWAELGKDTPERFKMLDVIVNAIKGKERIILAGDTNLNPDTEFVRLLQERTNVKSVFGNSLTSTFNMKHKTNPGFATAVVDMIFTTPDIKVIEKKQPDDDVSDHKPLIAILEI